MVDSIKDLAVKQSKVGKEQKNCFLRENCIFNLQFLYIQIYDNLRTKSLHDKKVPKQ